MAIFKCKMCGGDLQLNDNMRVGECGYCGTRQTLPRLDDDKRANLYDRANHFRRNGEFDKAAAIYDAILNEDKTDAEAYWSIVLCKYGIEYVEDPRSHKRIPTCNRTQFTSIFADEDYKQAIANADAAAKVVYEAEAKAIDEIQKGILNISAKEEPFDVFICYKESDPNGRRTPDSVLAQDLYYQLTQEGFKVFFSRITLEDKLGTAYEPYIFAALNSSKVMVAIGTKPENFNSPWVKNEWSRYLVLIKNGAKKIQIPAYKDMDPYDLPEEFSHLQAQDMSKLGFMQDLIRGIKKIISTVEPKSIEKEKNTLIHNAAVAPLLKRAFLCLEDGEFEKADELLEQVLNLDPEISKAYIGKLMVEMQIKEENDLQLCTKRIESNSNFKKAIRFADEKYRTILNEYSEAVSGRVLTPEELQYQKALSLMQKKDYNEAEAIFASLGDYNDSYEQLLDVKYNNALDLFNDKNYTKAISLLSSLGDYKDSKEKIALIIKNSFRTANIGDTIFLGNYYQSKDITPIKEPIEWIVLAKESNKLFLISRGILDCITYHDKQVSISWENSYLRKWLNDDFYNLAFNDSEKRDISNISAANFQRFSLFGNEIGLYYTNEKITLISNCEASYFKSNDNRKAKATDYAKLKGVSIDNNHNGAWWLRTPGQGGTSSAGLVNNSGDHVNYSRAVTTKYVGVRPAIWLNL